MNENQTPNGGWQFYQPETTWRAPTPIANTLSQTTNQVIAMRKKNTAITAKFQLATNFEAVKSEVIRFNRKRLGLPENETPMPFQVPHSQSASAAAAAVGGSMAGLKRAAQGTAVVIDWLRSGGNPVAQELANHRASVCVVCPLNKPGAWFTVAPAQLIKETLEARKDLKLETPFDEKLQSCEACKCLMRLKVWVDSKHILAHTKPEVFNDLDLKCWILSERKTAGLT